jgi:outer membrane protein assembly factor BamB
VRDRLWLLERHNVARVRVDDGVTEHVGVVQPTRGMWGAIRIGDIWGVAVGGRIVGTHGGVLVALDPETRAIVWKVAAPGVWQLASSDGAVLAAGYVGNDAGAVWALRGDSGASLWRRVLDVKGWVAQLVAPGDGRAYAVVEESGPGSFSVVACDVRALDAQTGKVRWSYQVPFANLPLANPRAPCGVAVDADIVVVAAPDGALHVLDAVTGSLRVRAPVDALLCDFREGFGMVVRAHMAYVLTGPPDDLAGMAPPPLHALVAIDLKTLATRWKLVGPLSEHTAAVADDDRIYVQTDGGEVLALSLLDGAVQWAWYAGLGGPTAMLVPPEAPHWLILASGVFGVGGTMGFDLHVQPRKGLIRTKIAGRIAPAATAFELSGIPVHVADQVVRTDALGRFSAEVRGQGYALVDAMPWSVVPRTPVLDPCPNSSVERVPLDAKAHTEVRITIEFPTCDED